MLGGEIRSSGRVEYADAKWMSTDGARGDVCDSRGVSGVDGDAVVEK